jgi:hypothetical protein
MPYHDENVFRRGHMQRRSQNMVQQSIASGLMQDFGLLRFHPRAETGRKNHNSNTIHFFL